MINTGLPFDFDDMSSIAEEGAIVDMSNLNYPLIDESENVKTSFIYLRNTDYQNIDLDFSKVSYDIKEQFLIFYLEGDIEYSIKELSNTWIKILLKYKNIDEDVCSILTDDEIKMFISNNESLVSNLEIFAYSLPLFSISRLDTEDFEFDFDTIKKTDYKFNANVCSIIQNNLWNLIYIETPNTEPMFYTNMFVDDNNLLFETIMKYTPFSVLLYGMNNQEEWKEFASMIQQIGE